MPEENDNVSKFCVEIDRRMPAAYILIYIVNEIDCLYSDLLTLQKIYRSCFQLCILFLFFFFNFNFVTHMHEF